MSADETVSAWLAQLKAGDETAAEKLWDRYFRRLVGLARKKLHDVPRRVADEEDVALSAFDSLCRGVERGRFTQLLDRDNLWRLLVQITARKAMHVVRDERRLKRGGGQVLGESALISPQREADAAAGLADVLGREPTPEFAVQVAEQCQQLLDHLGDAELRSIALWRMEGFSTEEIATKLDVSLSTIERKLRVIRSLLTKEGEP
jgi:DNA-directed RNA polymerase specialized sigma24 family protein